MFIQSITTIAGKSIRPTYMRCHARFARNNTTISNTILYGSNFYTVVGVVERSDHHCDLILSRLPQSDRLGIAYSDGFTMFAPLEILMSVSWVFMQNALRRFCPYVMTGVRRRHRRCRRRC